MPLKLTASGLACDAAHLAAQTSAGAETCVRVASISKWPHPQSWQVLACLSIARVVCPTDSSGMSLSYRQGHVLIGKPHLVLQGVGRSPFDAVTWRSAQEGND